MKTFTALSALLLGMNPLTSFAQDLNDDALELEEVTLFSNQTEVELDRNGASVSIITEEEIEEAGDISVSEILSRLPGVSVNSNGGLGGATTVRIRGLGNGYTKVFVDGIDVSDVSATQHYYDFGRLTTTDISRIEVLRGPQSAIYGAEAVGGVINISTNQATEEGTSYAVDLEAGSYNTQIGSFNISQLGERYAVAFTLSHVKTDGFSIADENAGNTETDGYLADRGSLSASFNLTDNFSVGMAGFYQETQSHGDDFGPVDGTPDDVINATSKGGRIFALYETDTQSHEFSIGSYKIERASTGTTSFGPYAYAYAGDNTTYAYKGTVTSNDELQFTFGAERKEQEYSSSFGGDGLAINSIFAEALYAPNDALDLSFSLRNDDHSTFGRQSSARFAFAYRPTDMWIIRGSVGNGYRSPSLFERFDSYSGNPNLLPEESLGADIGVERKLGEDGYVKATGFYNKVDKLIEYQYDFATFTGGYVQTDGITRFKGVELEGAYPISENLRVVGNATYTKATDNNGNQANRVPRRQANFGIEGDITDKFTMGALFQYTGSLRDSGTYLGGHSVTNVTATYQATEKVEAYARVENVFDKEYQDINGYGTSDRAIYVGLRTRF